MKWLADFTDVGDVNIKEYCDRMTDTGSKVEGYRDLAEDFSGIVCGKILKIEKHPEADRLVVCAVDIGGGSPIQVVTAATNVFEGALVPVCTDGARLPDGTKIKKGKLRGVLSEGMFCSVSELGLTTHDMPGAVTDGILILQHCGIDSPTLGADMKDVLDMRDSVVEFEITPNRPDCLSVIGLARESAVTFDRELHVPTPKVEPLCDGDDVSNYLKVDIKNPTLCPRYTAKAVKNVRIAPSPLWLRMRLRAAGVRPINNIVDITNYVMLEYGQPMHAFDYSCLDGSHIIVRNAAEGESFKSLDDKEHTLEASMLVIADEKKAVALAGVMGGANSEITDSTNTVIFESANFKGSSIRISGKKLGMRTESSARFEKGLDRENTYAALMRACELVQQLGAGDVVDGIIDEYPGKMEPVKIRLDTERINSFLGVDMSRDFIVKTLEKLEFKVDGDTVSVPSFRADVEQTADIAEEAVRIYGYNKIPSTAFRGAAENGGRKPHQQYELDVRGLLSAMGMYEIETFSFISPSYYDKIGLREDSPLRRSVVIKNPLGEDTSVMRTTALPSMLEVLSYNNSVKNKNVRMYEMATVYLPSDAGELPREPKRLVIGMYDDDNKGAKVFYKLKGYIEALLEYSGISNVTYKSCSDAEQYHPGRCAAVMCGEKTLGVFGEIHPAVCENYGFSFPVYCAEMNFDVMTALRSAEKEFHPLPKYPALERDFSFVCDEELETGLISDVIKKAGGKAVEKAELFDIYRSSQIGENKKSVAFAVSLRSHDHTMTDEEADGAVKKIMKALYDEFKIVLRS